VLAHPSLRHDGVCLAPSPRCRPRVTRLCVRSVPDFRGRRVPRAPLPGMGVTRAGATSKAAWRGVTPSSSLIRAHAPDHRPPRASGKPVVRAVFAGCRQSLLGDGPSRHYLCDPCAGARTHTPPRSSAARVHSLTEDTGLTPRETGSARETIPTWQFLRGAVFRGCSHSFTFGLLHSLGPQTAPTAALTRRAAGPFTPRIARPAARTGMWRRYMLDMDN
jgi:hypothetical protein